MIATSPATERPTLLDRYRPGVTRQLRATALAPTSMTGLMAAYHMGWVDREGRPDESAPGKLIRPSLCLWSCAAAGAEPGAALPLACAVEWVHNFTLVHDDIQDGDRERRHRETVWSVWGAAQGINAGDALHAFAFELLLAPGPHPGRRLRAGHALALAIRNVVEGQCQDLALEGRLGAGRAAYLRMARHKTGALLGACLEAGALIGGARAGIASRLRRAGQLLGLAFQVRDDWLGVWGEPALTGKSRECDLGRRKVTYPVVAGYSTMPATDRRRLRALFASELDGDADIPRIRSLLEDCGAPVLTAQAADEFAGEAIAIVSGCGLPAELTREFEEFARYAANRQR